MSNSDVRVFGKQFCVAIEPQVNSIPLQRERETVSKNGTTKIQDKKKDGSFENSSDLSYLLHLLQMSTKFTHVGLDRDE